MSRGQDTRHVDDWCTAFGHDTVMDCPIFGASVPCLADEVLRV